MEARRTGNIRRSAKKRRYYDAPVDKERRENARRRSEERRKEPVIHGNAKTPLVKKILVTGDRAWHDVPRVIEALQVYPPGTILVHGACRGADNICAAVGEELGFVVRGYPADWARYPRAAGPIRNQHMLDVEHVEGSPIDVCLAFHNRIDQSKGTADMIRRAEKTHIPVILNTSHVRLL